MFHVLDFDWDLDMFSSAETHTECIEWTTAQLAEHPRAKRMSYDMWYFERKRELEEFQTFWLLKWSEIQ